MSKKESNNLKMFEHCEVGSQKWLMKVSPLKKTGEKNCVMSVFVCL